MDARRLASGVTLGIVLSVLAVQAETYSVISPNGVNEIRLSTEPTLCYEVRSAGKVRVAASPVAMNIAGKPLLGGAGLKARSAVAADRKGVVASPIYKKATVDETAKGLLVSFGDWSVELVSRDDGVAYRFVTDFADDEVTVVSERAYVAFASPDQVVYAAPNSGAGADDPLQNSWEGVYRKRRVAEAPKDMSVLTNGLWYAPLTFTYPDGAAMCVQESDLWDYPGWNFQGTADGRALKGLFGAFPKRMIYSNWGKSYTQERTRYQRILERENYLAKTRGRRAYPWRVFQLAEKLAKLVESDIVYALASPNAIGDFSWVKPGKVSWDWWCCWNLTGVDFKAGVNTRTYEHFIDFASRHGIEYVIFDEGWSQKLNLLEFNPEVDVPHLIRYANERNVGIILWAAWSQFHGRIEELVARYADMGAKGFKVDFMDRDDQAAMRFLREFAAVCAKHRMIVDYHGMSKPAGFQRTFPNVLNFEGVHGLECLKGRSREYFPDMDCTLAFTRLLAGPADYTPGAMRNHCRGCYKPFPLTPGSLGTRVHQMALMTLFDAPLEMLCDSPSLYEANRECLDFMASLPVVWDDTVALDGEMDAFAALARRKGEAWYAAAICGWNGRQAKIDTSFLKSGKWQAEIFADGLNADRDAVDYRHFTKTITAGEVLEARLMPGGGWTARFTRSVEQLSHPIPKFSRKRLFPGFDGKFCKVQPSIATDGKGTAILGFQKLLLTGSDVFYGQYLAKSTDGGETWTEPRVMETLKDTVEDGFRVTRYATVYYSHKNKRWFGLGQACTYKNNSTPNKDCPNGKPYSWPLFVKLDPETATYDEGHPLAFPLPYTGCLPFGQQVEDENGDILVPFYYEPREKAKIGGDPFMVLGRIVVARCRFDGDMLKIVEVGRPVSCDGLRRGVGEPSLIRLGRKVYMTLRSDEAGMWSESEDGLNYSEPRRWTWTDGVEIGNRNTQQHWMRWGDVLYLTYTRETPSNGHVFRNRAPVFMAEFDPVAGGLMRQTEIALVPELGARLGNFCCAADGKGGSWFVTAEWMQPAGCEKYGSDNSFWLIRP